jgi:hypothetical protein
MFIEGFSIASDSITLIAVFIILLINNKTLSIKKPFEEIDRFITNIISWLKEKDAYRISITLRFFFILGIGFIVFFIPLVLPFLSTPEIYTQQSQSIYEVYMSNLQQPIPTTILYILNITGFFLLFYFPFKIFWDIIQKTQAEFNQDKIIINERLIPLFVVSIAALILSPIITFRPIDSNHLIGNTIIAQPVNSLFNSNILGVAIAIILIIYLLTHLIRKHNHLFDYITHIIPILISITYITLFITKTSFEINLYYIILFLAIILIWAIHIAKKHKRLIENKIISISLLL